MAKILNANRKITNNRAIRYERSWSEKSCGHNDGGCPRKQDQHRNVGTLVMQYPCGKRSGKDHG